MCLQRWSFLQGRFEELRKEESGMSEEIRMVVVEAAQTMRTAESRMGYTLSEWQPEEKDCNASQAERPTNLILRRPIWIENMEEIVVQVV